MKTGFINGCFDILHIGHIRMLQFAKNRCDKLIVAIDEDSRVKKLKGLSRPFNNQNDRVEFLRAIRCVDDVRMFSTDKELIDLIKNISPDIMIVGSEYRNKNVIGSEYAKKLLFFERIGDYSTSKIFEYSCNR